MNVFLVTALMLARDIDYRGIALVFFRQTPPIEVGVKTNAAPRTNQLHQRLVDHQLRNEQLLLCSWYPSRYMTNVDLGKYSL